jgi:Glutamate decarboxylase and related PLP-dependent proteins
LNANLTIWRSAPAPVELERLTIDWIRQILGFNPEAGGLFVSGGSMANLAALAAARQTKYDSLGRLRMYASSATHFSITKAAALLGIGRENLRHVAIDERFKMRVDDLVAKITADLKAGYVPFCVVGNAEPWIPARSTLTEIREVAEPVPALDACGWKLWCFAILAQSARKIIRGYGAGGFDRADPHKWLYLPVDVGCVIYRNPEIARATFAHEAEYTRMFGEEADEAFVCWDYGPELSRRFRALKVWMLLKGVGSIG